MKRKIKRLIWAAVLLAALLVGLFYTRPATIEQRYPMLDLSRCTEIRGYYRGDSPDPEEIPFAAEAGTPEFEALLALFQEQTFRTRLGNLIPTGTRTHRIEAGDFKWEVLFRFEDVHFPSGDVGRGDLLQVHNFFGELDLFFDGETVKCRVPDQDAWLRAVMDAILLCETEE